MLYSAVGQATRVQFHVTVMSLDSIDEGSMVSSTFFSSRVLFNSADFLFLLSSRQMEFKVHIETEFCHQCRFALSLFVAVAASQSSVCWLVFVSSC